MHVELTKLPFDVDIVTVARQSRYGENPNPGLIGADSRQAHGRRHIDIRGETAASLTRRAIKDLLFMLKIAR